MASLRHERDTPASTPEKFNARRPPAPQVVRAILGTLAGVIFLRVLGVSLLLAGFVEYAHSLGGSTAEAGLAFGAYPLALALFMLPLAMLSDRVGRRPVMLGALAVSAAGGIAAAFAPDIVTLGLARFVQGAGAVNGVALALAGETGEPGSRTRRMALLGAAAGIGFAAGILLGAWLVPLVGIPGLLLGHSAATLAILLPIARVVPDAAAPLAAPGPRRSHPLTLVLGVGAFAVNLSMTGLLFLSPLLVERAAPGTSYVLVLTAMVLPGGLGMFLASRLADRGHARAVGLGAAALLGLAPLVFLGTPGAALLVAGGIAYFIGHSSLSSLLPSLAAGVAQEGRRGFAQGVQSTLQYLGSFVGASIVGALYPRSAALAAVFLGAGLLVALAVSAAARRAR